MCTGVIVITATMTDCEITIDARASLPLGVATTTVSASFMLGSFTLPFSLMPPATTNGSGRNRTAVFTKASNNMHAENAHGPVYLCHPNHSCPAASAGEIRSGPNTAPNVDANTIRLIAWPRCSGTAKSVAAYLASKFEACPFPKRNNPTRNNGSTDICAPNAAITAPTVANRYPNCKPGRRPRRIMMREST